MARTMTFYSKGNHDGMYSVPAKHRSMFESVKDFKEYERGYKDACEGIYENEVDDFNKEVADLKGNKDMGSLVDAPDRHGQQRRLEDRHEGHDRHLGEYKHEPVQPTLHILG